MALNIGFVFRLKAFGVTSVFARQSPITKGLLLLCVSSSLFATMGVFIRLASQSVDNEHVVFFRNLVTLVLLGSFYLSRGPRQFLTSLKTTQFGVHVLRTLTGLTAMYGFFYAIATIDLANAMIFTYAAPVFLPLVAFVALKEPMNARMWLAAGLGFVGVFLVTKPSAALFDWISVIGIGSAVLAACAFVCVRSLTKTESATKIVFYFALLSTLISAVPALLHPRGFSSTELGLLLAAGLLATLSQIVMSKAYSFAPAGVIGPANYLAILVAGFWGFSLWGQTPDWISVLGMGVILMAIFMSSPDALRALKHKIEHLRSPHVT